jgi:hypothetical protein
MLRRGYGCCLRQMSQSALQISRKIENYVGSRGLKAKKMTGTRFINLARSTLNVSINRCNYEQLTAAAF